jgi:hypothetical protein
MKKILFFVSFITMLAFTVSAQDSTTTITCRNNGFSVDVPADWIIMFPNLDSTSIVVMSNEGLSQEVTVFYDSLYDNGVKKTFDQVCEIYIQDGIDSSIYQLKDRGKTVINGMDCYWTVWTDTEGSSMSTVYYYNLGKDHMLVVICDAGKEYFEKYEKLYKKIFNSVKKS